MKATRDYKFQIEVEVYDPSDGDYRQISREQRMENLFDRTLSHIRNVDVMNWFGESHVINVEER